MKQLSGLMILFSALAFSSSASAAIDAVYTGFFNNNAVSGYDTVAYFTIGEPVEGSDDFTHQYMGATWKFASQEHLDLFAADPEKYAPQYGGYCAWAMANGDTASAEPDLWTIHEGKLYLNYSRRVMNRWLGDKEALIQKADVEWPKFDKE